MKKIILVCVLLLFLIFAYFGFNFASKIIPGFSKTQTVDLETSVTTEVATLENEAAVETDTPTNVVSENSQENYLVIHVSDSTSEKPELISAWVAFVYHSNPAKIMFMPLYPSYENRINRRIGNSFRINKNGDVSSWFIRQIENVYEFEIAGYILADDLAVKNSGTWLTGQEPQIIASPSITEEERHSVRLIGQTNYQQFCQLVSSGSVNNYFSTVNWSILLPNHFSTNLSFETISLTVDQIIRNGSATQCNVLSNE